MTFEPTQTSKGNPTTCHCCGRHAQGIGIGRLPGDPRYLCRECVTLIERIRSVRRFDPYEEKALEGAVDAVGDYIASIDGKTDLGDFDEAERRGLVRAAVVGFGDSLRSILENGIAPF